MYFYLYDSFLSDKRFERDVAAIETRLTDLGVSGKIGRLTPFVSARGLVRDETRRGAQTIVVVGNDATVAKVVEGLGEEKVTLGIIPVGEPTHIAASLGIPTGVDACDVLSKRVMQKIDLGLINGRYFLSDVRIAESNLTIEGEGKYRITPETGQWEIVVSNLRRQETEAADPSVIHVPGDPMDGFLDAVMTPKSARWFSALRFGSRARSSVIPLKRLSITSEESFNVVADGREFTQNAISIEIAPDRLKVITGRERAFA